MKTLLVVFGLTFGGSAFAANLFYSNGPVEGMELAKDPSYLIYNDVCFVASGVNAQRSLQKILLKNTQMSSPFARYDANKDVINYGFVDTMCVDDGRTYGECRELRKAKRCR
jgi:hypothetical protein